MRSVVLGVVFFAIDLLWAYLHGRTNPLNYPAGLLGIPLTVAICPGFTMICAAGLVRLSIPGIRSDLILGDLFSRSSALLLVDCERSQDSLWVVSLAGSSPIRQSVDRSSD
jgi:hypothetical protein